MRKKFLNKYLLFAFMLVIFFPACSTYSQAYFTAKTAEVKMKKQYDKAVSLARAEQYSEALEVLEKLLENAPNFIDAQILLASIKYDSNLLEEAEASFESVLALAPDYKNKLWYNCGLTEWKLNKFEEAIPHFEQFLERETKQQELIDRAVKHLANCRFAAEAVKHPVPFNPENLGDSINSTREEYLPSLPADGQSLIYTARVNRQEDFFISKKQDSVWQKGQPLEALNTPLNEGAHCISADGNLLIFTACNRRDGWGSCDLYYSVQQEGKWTEPKNMGTTINSAAWESQPSLSANGKYLFFSSNRRGGKGSKDIWVCFRQENGDWSKPYNLGKPINTSENEQTPFFHPDGRTLYFTSEGHPGMGGSDLFVSKTDDDGRWGMPVNLGFPINTKANEGALFVRLDGKMAYFARGKVNEGEDTDIYRFELHEAARAEAVTYVKAKVFDAKSRRPLEAGIAFANLENGKVHFNGATAEDGTFLVCLPMGKDYALNISKENYLFHSEHFSLTTTAALSDPFLLEIPLQLIPKDIKEAEGKPIVLNNVFFETGSAELKQASQVELLNLKKLLEDNPALRIRINGHTDNVGSEEDNLLLSENRAKAVYSFLVENEIAATRLDYKGFGENQPIGGNDTEGDRQKNRRTEFEVIRD